MGNVIRGDTIYKTEIKKLFNRLIKNSESSVSQDDLSSMVEEWQFVLENNTIVTKNVVCLTSQQ